MFQYKATMEESKEYIHTIMDQVCDVLEKNSIDFTRDASTIIVPKKDRKEISSLIRTLPIPKGVLYFALDVCQVKDKVYIRKKIK